MVHGWMRRVSKKHVSKKRKKRRHPSDFVRHMLTDFTAETKCGKVYAGQVFE